MRDLLLAADISLWSERRGLCTVHSGLGRLADLFDSNGGAPAALCVPDAVTHRCTGSMRRTEKQSKFQFHVFEDLVSFFALNL